jgi:hypothetical protein
MKSAFIGCRFTESYELSEVICDFIGPILEEELKLFCHGWIKLVN